ncbi:hypothetical protein ACHAXT_006812 [Thalassiosira profunda]
MNDKKRARSPPANDAAATPADGAAAPLTKEGEMPQKRFYRARAHCNPLSFNETFEYPAHPGLMDWTEDHYPAHPALTTKESDGESGDAAATGWQFAPAATTIQPDVLDVGCGFGGLTLALATALPRNTVLGLEIRTKVAEYVRLRIVAQRKEHPGKYQNCSVMRTNAMKYLPNFFRKGSLEKLFFCFPDPHFKRKNHPRRIVSERLLTEYAYLLKPSAGRLYCITDVKDLHAWHVAKCDAHPLFEELSAEETEGDPCVALMKSTTEEGKKVQREGKFGHEMYYKVYQRVEGAAAEGGVTAENFFREGQFGVEVVEKK